MELTAINSNLVLGTSIPGKKVVLLINLKNSLAFALIC
jgi:hypothetical protein